MEEILRGFTMEQKAAKMVGRAVGRGLGLCLARAVGVGVSLCSLPERPGERLGKGGPCHRPGRDTRRALHPEVHRGEALAAAFICPGPTSLHSVAATPHRPQPWNNRNALRSPCVVN